MVICVILSVAAEDRNPTVVSIVNQKGGVGKTTLAIHLATALAERSSVVLVDADPQGSALDWQAQRDASASFPVVGLARPILHREVRRLAPGCSWIIIDSPPRASSLTRSAIAASDLTLIPVQPSPLDIWASQDILRILDEVSPMMPSLCARFVVNRLFAGTHLAREVHQALDSFNVPTLNTVIRNRTEYAKAVRQGYTAIETLPHSPAALDFRTLADEIHTTAKEKFHATS